MNAQFTLLSGEIIPHPFLEDPCQGGAAGRPGLVALLASPRSDELLLTLAAHLAWRGAVRVLDGGNRFSAYRLARALARMPGHLQRADPQPALERVTIARAFTCYQMAALLSETPGGCQPVLVSDLLDTFYDQSASLVERRRLLQGCLDDLTRLSREAVVVVHLRPPHRPQVDAAGLLERVQSVADQILFQEELAPPPRQLTLL